MKPMNLNKVTLSSKFAQISNYWQPAIVGELNGQAIKLVKCKGAFTWHHHTNEDEMFLVVKGSFVMELLDKHITLEEGEFLIVPKGVEHRPNAAEEVWIMLFEPIDTLNTGNLENEFTHKNVDKI